MREKLLEEYNDVFADIFNFLLFREEVLDQEKLKEGSTESIYKALSDITDIPPQFVPYVQNYKVKVFDIAFLDDDTINCFKSDFRLIAKFFKNRRLRKNPLDDVEEIEHVTELLDFLTVFTNDSKYEQTKHRIEELKKKGVKVSMCWVAQELWEKGENKLARLISYLLENGLSDEVQKAAADETARKEMYIKYGIED